jgi:hypothetical protein
MIEPNWRASGRPQEKSPKAPKKIKRAKKRRDALRLKLKQNRRTEYGSPEHENGSGLFCVCDQPQKRQMAEPRKSSAHVHSVILRQLLLPRPGTIGPLVYRSY